ncbi:MAG: 1-(5-phosphoribosyl)-5-[(5-phosphoribosylamino)methylideneamino]imidazole-4-carboxamide isomerase [Candidatus Hodgkinia cicadicola]
MQFIPSIDIKDGKCVRLYKGDLTKCQVYEASPLSAIHKYGLNKASWLHVVDLDGAVAGEPRNMDAIASLLQNVDCRVQVGGGIRSLKTIRDYLLLGASRVVLGTSALTSPSLILKATKKHLGKIALGLDTIRGHVAIQGWTKLTNETYKQTLARLAHLRISVLVWTDVTRDGTLSGINTGELTQVINVSKLPVIVSGGISSLEELKSLRDSFGNSIAGVISGKAIYEGAISVEDALNALHSHIC